MVMDKRQYLHSTRVVGGELWTRCAAAAAGLEHHVVAGKRAGGVSMAESNVWTRKDPDEQIISFTHEATRCED